MTLVEYGMKMWYNSGSGARRHGGALVAPVLAAGSRKMGETALSYGGIQHRDSCANIGESAKRKMCC